MPKHNDNRPITIKDIHEVLIPAMEEVFLTKKDLAKFANGNAADPLKRSLAEFKKDFDQFQDKFLSNQEKMIRGLETLLGKRSATVPL